VNFVSSATVRLNYGWPARATMPAGVGHRKVTALISLG